MSNALEKVGAAGIAGCIITVIAVPLLILNIVLMGFVTMKMWNWFLPALGVGAPIISMGQAVGIRMVWVCFNRSVPKMKNGEESTDKQKNDFVVSVLSWAILSPLFLLTMGFVVKTIVL